MAGILSLICSRKSLLFLCLSVASVAFFLPTQAHAIQLGSNDWPLDVNNATVTPGIRGQDVYGVGDITSTGTVKYIQMYVKGTDVTRALVIEFDNVDFVATDSDRTCTSETGLIGSDYNLVNNQFLLVTFEMTEVIAGGCVVNPHTTIGAYDLTYGSGSGYVHKSTVDDGIVTSAFYDANSDPNNLEPPCVGCTYIVSQIPNDRSIEPDTTVDFTAQYYINPNDVDDFANVYLRLVWKSTKVTSVFEDQQLYSGGVEENAYASGLELLFQGDFTSYATGTHYLSYDIYERIDPPLWKFWDTSFTEKQLAKDDGIFFIASETSLEELQALLEQSEAEQAQLIASTYSDCNENGIFSQTCFNEKISGAVDVMQRSRPIGYGYRIYEILSATSSTSTSLTMAFTFPTTSPVAGTAISLPITSPVDDAIDFLNANPDFPDAYEEAMVYWDFFWYTILIFWILQQIFGSFNIDFNSNSTNRNNVKITDINSGGWKKINIKDNT